MTMNEIGGIQLLLLERSRTNEPLDSCPMGTKATIHWTEHINIIFSFFMIITIDGV